MSVASEIAESWERARILREFDKKIDKMERFAMALKKLFEMLPDEERENEQNRLEGKAGVFWRGLRLGSLPNSTH